MVSILFILLKGHEKLPVVWVWCWRVTARRRRQSFAPSSSGSFSALLMPWASCQLLEKNPWVTDLQLTEGFTVLGLSVPLELKTL